MILFKGRKIRSLLDKYISPDISEKNREIISELEKLGPDVFKFTVEYFQHRKLTPAKALYLFEKLTDDSSQEAFLDLLGDPYDEMRRVAKIPPLGPTA